MPTQNELWEQEKDAAFGEIIDNSSEPEPQPEPQPQEEKDKDE
jgi:hypothetical protein